MAADLALAGHDVVLVELSEFAERLQLVTETRSIRSTGMGRTGTAHVAQVTYDVGAAAAQAGVLNIVVPAYGHRRFFEELLPHLRSDHVPVVWAGDFGSLELRALVRAHRPDLSLEIVETNTLPYGTRLLRQGEVHTSVLAPKVLAASLPCGEDVVPSALATLQKLWPSVTHWPEVISVGLSNPNPIVHQPGALLNVGHIEYYSESFNLYRHGITEAVARVIRCLYEEVRAVADALGAKVPEYADRDFRTRTSIMGVAFQADFDTDKVIGDIAGPSSVDHRYITEDLPYGLVPIAQLGRRAGVETHLIESLVTLGSAVCGRDFWKEARGLDRLGLSDLAPDEIVASVRHTVFADAADGAAPVVHNAPAAATAPA
jgi:opine dehydrogenase